MKKPLPLFRGIEGTIMIFSLFIILGGTLVLAAWVQMLATRATYTATTEEGVKRRIAMENGRALARQYILNQMPSGSIAYFTTNLDNGAWGGFQINSNSATWTNTNFSIGNPFNPIGDDSFVVTNLVNISNSVESCNWTFFVRSRSPVLAGFPAVFHNPLLTSDTNQFTNVTTYKIYWSNLVGLSNSPDIPFTSGYTASGSGTTNAYIGYFASPMNTNYPNPVDITPSSLSVTNTNTNAPPRTPTLLSQTIPAEA